MTHTISVLIHSLHQHATALEWTWQDVGHGASLTLLLSLYVHSVWPRQWSGHCLELSADGKASLPFIHPWMNMLVVDLKSDRRPNALAVRIKIWLRSTHTEHCWLPASASNDWNVSSSRASAANFQLSSGPSGAGDELLLGKGCQWISPQRTTGLRLKPRGVQPRGRPVHVSTSVHSQQRSARPRYAPALHVNNQIISFRGGRLADG